MARKRCQTPGGGRSSAWAPHFPTFSPASPPISQFKSSNSARAQTCPTSSSQWKIDRLFAATNSGCSTPRRARRPSRRSSGITTVFISSFCWLFIFLQICNSSSSSLPADQSKAYKDFLNFIGERIELKNWKGYRAGLDVNGWCPPFDLIFLFFDPGA